MVVEVYHWQRCMSRGIIYHHCPRVALCRGAEATCEPLLQSDDILRVGHVIVDGIAASTHAVSSLGHTFPTEAAAEAYKEEHAAKFRLLWRASPGALRNLHQWGLLQTVTLRVKQIGLAVSLPPPSPDPHSARRNRAITVHFTAGVHHKTHRRGFYLASVATINNTNSQPLPETLCT